MKSQVLLTVWCHISCEAAGEFWHWSLSGVKGLRQKNLKRIPPQAECCYVGNHMGVTPCHVYCWAGMTDQVLMIRGDRAVAGHIVAGKEQGLILVVLFFRCWSEWLDILASRRSTPCERHQINWGFIVCSSAHFPEAPGWKDDPALHKGLHILEQKRASQGIRMAPPFGWWRACHTTWRTVGPSVPGGHGEPPTENNLATPTSCVPTRFDRRWKREALTNEIPGLLASEVWMESEGSQRNRICYPLDYERCA